MYGQPDFIVGGTLRRTWDIARQQASTLVGLSFILYALPVAILGLLPMLGLIPSAEATREAIAAGQPMQVSASVALIVYGLASVLILFIGNLLATAAAIWVAHENLRGRPADFASGAARAIRVLPGNLAMIILLTLGVMLGSLLLVVPGVMLILRWSAAVPALVVERAGILGSLGRSRDLTKGQRWRVLGFLLVMALVNFVVFGVASFGVGLFVALLSGSTGRVVSILAGLVTNSGFVALAAAASAALYFELRRNAEGTLSADTVDAFS